MGYFLTINHQPSTINHQLSFINLHSSHLSKSKNFSSSIPAKILFLNHKKQLSDDQ